jgi:hypothetical protein
MSPESPKTSSLVFELKPARQIMTSPVTVMLAVDRTHSKSSLIIFKRTIVTVLKTRPFELPHRKFHPIRRPGRDLIHCISPTGCVLPPRKYGELTCGNTCRRDLRYQPQMGGLAVSGSLCSKGPHSYSIILKTKPLRRPFLKRRPTRVYDADIFCAQATLL